jgi:murein DD-endopeptidase MepM/ murein hydrolase activator NlpD
MTPKSQSETFDPQRRWLLILFSLLVSVPFSLASFADHQCDEVNTGALKIAASFPKEFSSTFTNTIQGPEGPALIATSLEKTATGFYYPLGRSSTGGYRGWMKPNPRFQNLDGSPQFHLGIDYKAAFKDPVYAIAPGVIVDSKRNIRGFGGSHRRGGAMLIEHRTKDGLPFLALYGSLENVASKKEVSAGEQIGTIGHYFSTDEGHRIIDTPRLHFGIYPGGFLPMMENRWLEYTPSASESFGWVDPIDFLEKHFAPSDTSPAPPEALFTKGCISLHFGPF